MNYRQFKISAKALSVLSKEERKIIKILEGVVKDTAEVYQQQLKDGFYPKGLKKESLEEAAKKHSLILSPFTFITEMDGHLVGIYYHLKYAGLLKPIAEKINEAAKLSTNSSFKKYLKARARSLLDGNYKEADIAWLKVKNSLIDFSIGPFERYLDKLLFTKRVFQAHIGIINSSMTKKANEAKEVLYSSAKMSFDKAHSTNIPKKGVTVLVEDILATAGYAAEAIFSGEHFPSDLDVMQQYGARVIIYNSQLRLKFEKFHYPIFKTIFEKRFASKYSKELLLEATGWSILLYELGRQLHKFIGARERLQELYGPIDEANGVVSGIEHAKYLLVKGLLSQELLEAIIIIHIVWLFSDWVLYQENNNLAYYVLGDAIILNTYLLQGALKEKGGISWPNFSKMFFEIELISGELTSLLKEGDYQQVQNYVRERAGLDNFSRLTKNLKNIKPNI